MRTDERTSEAPQTAAGDPQGDGRDDDQGSTELDTTRQEDPREDIEEPARLIRIASAVQTMLQEVRTTELDEAARQRLTDIHNRTVENLRTVVTGELEEELHSLTLEPDEGTPSGSELRVMQAQLSGWLQGLFHGIQASIATQQAAAQQQLSRMRGGQGDQQEAPPGGGQYL